MVSAQRKGNYSGSRIETGSNPDYAVNNIYDMAGNVWDWTLEANDTLARIERGGFYYSTGSSYPASSRDYYGSPTLSDDSYGSRVTLYVAL